MFQALAKLFAPMAQYQFDDRAVEKESLCGIDIMSMPHKENKGKYGTL